MTAIYLSDDVRARPIPSSWGPALIAYREALQAAGQRAATVTLRMAQLARLARAFPAGPGIDGAALLQWAAAAQWSHETRRSTYAAIRRFYAYALEAGHVDANPAAALPAVRPGPAAARPAPEVAYRHALASSSERVRLIVRLAAEVGLRRGEIVAIVPARDLSRDLLGYSLTVHGKGGRDRVVPLPAHIGIELERAAGGGYLFPSSRSGHISPAYAGKLARRVLPEPWTLHTLRHRFATKAYSAERDLFAVQTLLGHRSPETTRRYVADDPAALRAAMSAAGLSA